VAVDRGIQIAIGAGSVEAAGDRLEKVLIGDSRNPVLQRDLVGVVSS
jgi:hypothetical protein